MKQINVSHGNEVVSVQGLHRQAEHDRLLAARRLADRVDAVPPRPARPARIAPTAPQSSQSRESSALTRAGEPNSPAPASPTPTTASGAQSGPRVIEVGKARQRQAERRAERANLDRIDAVLDRALSEQRFTGGLGW